LPAAKGGLAIQDSPRQFIGDAGWVLEAGQAAVIAKKAKQVEPAGRKQRTKQAENAQLLKASA
jgi:hypothetical protein